MNCPVCHNPLSIAFCGDYDYWCDQHGGILAADCDDIEEEGEEECLLK